MALNDITDKETLFLGLSAPARDAFTVTPNDSTDFTIEARALWVGGAGNIRVLTSKGTDITFTGVLAGSILPQRCKRVFATSTTATNINGFI